MKKILFISALKGELDVVRKLHESQPSIKLEADFFITGVGCEKTSLSLEEKLFQNSYDFVINIGVCGYICTPNTCIQVIKSTYMQTQKELMVPVFFQHAPLSQILCSDTPVYSLDEYPYVDMESYAVEQVCEKFRVGRIILKVPIDKVGEETKNFDKNKAQKTLEENIDMPKLLEQIEEHLSNLPKRYNIEQYSSHYKLTFSENILFERYFHKYTSVLKEDFGDFFIAHRHMQKKEFLKNLCEKLSSYSLS